MERARDLSHRQLEYTQQQLQQEEEARRTSEQQATLAALDWQRMAAALQLERLIKWVHAGRFAWHGPCVHARACVLVLNCVQGGPLAVHRAQGTAFFRLTAPTWTGNGPLCRLNLHLSNLYYDVTVSHEPQNVRSFILLW